MTIVFKNRKKLKLKSYENIFIYDRTLKYQYSKFNLVNNIIKM